MISHTRSIVLTLCVFALAVFTIEVAAQDDEAGGLPPALKALDQQGNRDGRIQRAELPDRLLRFFDSTDLDGDRVLTWHRHALLD